MANFETSKLVVIFPLLLLTHSVALETTKQAWKNVDYLDAILDKRHHIIFFGTQRINFNDCLNSDITGSRCNVSYEHSEDCPDGNDCFHVAKVALQKRPTVIELTDAIQCQLPGLGRNFALKCERPTKAGDSCIGSSQKDGVSGRQTCKNCRSLCCQNYTLALSSPFRGSSMLGGKCIPKLSPRQKTTVQPLSTPKAPIKKLSTPLPTQKTLINTKVTLLPNEKAPNKTQSIPLPDQKAPIKTQSIPLPDQKSAAKTLTAVKGEAKPRQSSALPDAANAEPITTLTDAPTIDALKVAKGKPRTGPSENDGQGTNALAIGVGIGLAVAFMTVGLVIAIIAFFRKKRNVLVKKRGDLTGSYSDPHSNILDEENKDIQLTGSFDSQPDAGQYYNETNEEEYYDEFDENVYNMVEYEEPISKDEMKRSASIRLKYEKYKPRITPLNQETQQQTSVSVESAGNDVESCIYFELTDYDTQSVADGSAKYSLGTCDINSLSWENNKDTFVCSRETDTIETPVDNLDGGAEYYSVALQDDAVSESHVHIACNDSGRDTAPQGNSEEDSQMYELTILELMRANDISKITNDEKALSEELNFICGEGISTALCNTTEKQSGLGTNQAEASESYNLIEEEPNDDSHFYDEFNTEQDIPEINAQGLLETLEDGPREAKHQRDLIQVGLHEMREIAEENLKGDLATYDVAEKQTPIPSKNAFAKTNPESKSMYSLASTIVDQEKSTSGEIQQATNSGIDLGYSHSVHEIDVSCMALPNDASGLEDTEYLTPVVGGQRHSFEAPTAPQAFYDVLRDNDEPEYFILEDELETDREDEAPCDSVC